MSDIVKDLTNYRIKGIEKAEVEFYESLTRTLDKIEDQIVSLIDSLNSFSNTVNSVPTNVF